MVCGIMEGEGRRKGLGKLSRCTVRGYGKEGKEKGVGDIFQVHSAIIEGDRERGRMGLERLGGHAGITVGLLNSPPHSMSLLLFLSCAMFCCY